MNVKKVQSLEPQQSDLSCPVIRILDFDLAKRYGDEIYVTNFHSNRSQNVEKRIHIFNITKQRWSYLPTLGTEFKAWKFITNATNHEP